MLVPTLMFGIPGSATAAILLAGSPRSASPPAQHAAPG
ncbi:hypothetical protein C8E95_0001, partial [Pseudonocardia autotrophica]